MPGAVTQSEKRKAEYLIGYLEEPGDDRAKDAAGRAASGAGHHEKRRILECLKKNMSLRDSSRPGGPCYYDDELLAKAEAMLLADTTGMMTGEELHRQCKETGILWPKSDKDQFIMRLKEYVTQHGHKLNTSSRANTFFLAKSDMKDRVKFSTKMLPTVQRSLHSLVFVDETTIEESSHPKGKHACHALHETHHSTLQFGGCLPFHAHLHPHLATELHCIHAS